MPIIISKNGKNATKLDKTNFALEDHLQQYIYDNPEVIPLYDIKEDIHLLILAREFTTLSGPIDAVGVDKDGELYLVETKLYRNPDKRYVVAQVLDYGAALWNSFPDFDSFLLKLETAAQEKFSQTVRDRIRTYFSLDDETVETLISNMARNLDEGKFKFVVLMDNLHERLKDLIIYVNQNSKFDIYGVELEFYKHDAFEIIIPKLFGAEVKKDVANSKPNVSFISDQEFVEFYKNLGLEDKLQEVLRLHKEMQAEELHFDGWSASRTPKNINFDYSLGGLKKSLIVSIGINREEACPLSFWLYDKEIEEKVISNMEKVLRIKGERLGSQVKFGIVAKWPLKDFSKDKLSQFFSRMWHYYSKKPCQAILQ